MITGWEPLGISAVSNFSGWIEAVIVIVAPLLSHAIHWNTLKTSNTSVLFQCIDLRDHSSGIWTVFFSLIFFYLLSFSLFFFLGERCPNTSTNINLITVRVSIFFSFFFTFRGNMLCSQDNMPATQRMNMMQPILPCHIFNAFNPLKKKNPQEGEDLMAANRSQDFNPHLYFLF